MVKKSICFLLLLLCLICLPLPHLAVLAQGPANDLSSDSSIASSRDSATDSSKTKETTPDPVKATLLSDRTGIVAGGKFKLGVQFAIQKGWHTYYKDPGDSGMPPNFTWTLPTGFSAGPILWQKPHKTVEAEIVAYGYEDTVLHVTEITAPAGLKVGDQIVIKVKTKYLVCKEICLPGQANLEITLPVVAAGADKASPAAAAFDAIGPGFSAPLSSLTVDSSPAKASSTAAGAKFSIFDEKFSGASATDASKETLLNYLLPAFIGGLILNVMPCVLPVIAIKVLSLLEQAKEEPARVKLLGLIFSSGIISSFMSLALVVIAIKAAGQSVGWGFQFQYPAFVVVMSAVIMLMALSLFGLFYVNVQANGEIDKLARQEGLTGTFFKGVMATVLSTPCTAPFLGASLGFAFAQPAYVIALIFFTVALGMSSPYLLLTINPKWMKFLPKPGDWMEKFKQSMGFILLFTVVWLDSVLATEVSSNALLWVNVWLVGLAFCAWIVASYSDLTSTQNKRLRVYAAAAAVLAFFTYICFFYQPGVLAALTPGAWDAKTTASTASGAAIASTSEYGITWEHFTVDRLNEALAQKKTVFLDFTADWCLTCKVNEKTVLATRDVSAKMKALNVVTMQADWTRQDADITKLLNKFHRSGVPLYVIFPGSRPDQPIVLPEVIDQGLVIAKLQEAAQ